MAAKFAIRQTRKTRIFYGRYMDRMGLPVFARGPGYATTIVTDLSECLSADFAACGFALDHDHQRAVVFDDAVTWDVAQARAQGRTPALFDKVEDVLALDLYPYERCLVDPFATALTPTEWFEALMALPLEDSWKGWQLRWISSSTFSAELGAFH